MRQNVVIFVALFAVIALGLWGQYEISPDRVRNDFLAVLYEVLMLFAFEGDWTRELHLPWQLEVARLLAPTVSVAGIIIVLTRGAWVTLTNSFIRFRNDHVVIVGLGNKGWQFAQSCMPQHKVVIVERNADNSLIERARNEGIPVIVGDFLDQKIMTATNVRNARHLLTFCGNDGVSVEVAIRTREYLRELPLRDRRLRIHLHVAATEVSSRLEHYSKFYDDHKAAEVDFFGVNDLTARILLEKYPPDTFADVLGQKQVHIALYRLNDLAAHILTEAVQICHFLNGSKVRFSIFDSGADEKARQLLELHPGLKQLCEVNTIEVSNLNALQLRKIPQSLLQSVTEHVICFDSDDENLELALVLRDCLLEKPGCNAPINVRMQHASGLARLLEAVEGEPEIPDGIYPFGMLDEVLYHDNILSEGLDELAHALHDDYLMRRQNVETDRRLYTSLNEWNELPEPERKSSRLQADHLAAKLRAVRCRHRKGPPNSFEFSREEAEALARMEHERWHANKIYEGWKGGSERIEGAKINPFNVPWESIEDSERRDQIDSISRLPHLLQSRLGWRIEREFYIGVTGHRPHRVDLTDAALLSAIDRTLNELAASHSDRRLIIVSPLAEGADRVLARMALDHFGMALHVPLPLPFELYETDFDSRESLDEFKALLGRAEVYYELPTRFGTIESLASHTDGTPNEARNKQYALAGAYITQVADELIAVYDGKPAQGTGGTAEVIEWRKASVLPDDLRNDSDFFVRPTSSEPIIIGSDSRRDALS